MDASVVLFDGLRFDRKRFGKDMERFRKKDHTSDDLSKESYQPDGGNAKDVLVNEESIAAKKRKRKQVPTCDTVSLFKSMHMVSSVSQSKTGKKPKLQLQQEQCKEVELGNICRKKYHIHVAGCNVPLPLATFEELRKKYQCKPYLLHNIIEAGYSEPTPIQRQAIPVLLSGRECFACAPTGSGKTLAFILPILAKLKVPERQGIRALVLSPTRELAKQITREFKKLSKGKKFRIRLLTKALSRCADFSNLPCDVLVSTPLRLAHLQNNSTIDLSKVEHLVLDESDKLFELGFIEQIDSVVNACTNPSIRRSFFSATLPDSVEELARSIMHDAIRITIGAKNSASQTISQRLVFVGSEEGKLLAARQILKEDLQPPMLVFVQSKERAKELHRELAFDDVNVDSIHADLTQAQRERAVEEFRAGKTWVLIATDLMARGMDFKGVNCVVNFDFPTTAAAYIHRIGRSGRAGRRGEAVTLYTEDDVPFIRPIANVVAASGCPVPPWMLSLPKARKRKRAPTRGPLSMRPKLRAAKPYPKTVAKGSR